MEIRTIGANFNGSALLSSTIANEIAARQAGNQFGVWPAASASSGNRRR
jgi:hypothetical protein